jgi:TolB-like protein
LWKEVRGTDEAQRRGGQLQGVEYVETGGIAECDGGTRVELETASLDRFSVLWTRGVDSSADCHVAVRFNFLSTDFSHSKGVKGILSRLCAKTEIISPNSLYFPSEISEICVCDVKVFRDHGAERKTSNDVAYVKKSIEKLKQQIVQAEAGTKHSKKRKRNGSNVVEIELGGPVKDPKHKTSPPRSSASLTEDLYANLQTMRDMFISTQPVSVFYVLGQEQDGRDPYSPLPIDGLLQPHSQHLRRPPDRPVEVQLPQQVTPGNPTRWTKPLQVDFASKPLPDGLVEPGTFSARRRSSTDILLVACFYVCYREPHPSATKEYYRAVYIMKGETKCLIAAIAAKCSFDPTRILQVVNVIQKAPGIKVDDDIAHGLPKCHEMVLDLSRITALPLMREWDKLAYATLNRKEVKAVLDAIQSEGYLLKLMF